MAWSVVVALVWLSYSRLLLSQSCGWAVDWVISSPKARFRGKEDDLSAECGVGAQKIGSAWENRDKQRARGEP